MTRKHIFIHLFLVLIGLVLLAGGMMGWLDEYWSGMGGAIIAVGALRSIRIFRYHSNEDYRSKTDRTNRDERNKFLSTKAWAWAGYLFVLIAGVASILLKIAGQETLMMAASGSLCLLITLYWLSFLVLSRKY